MTKDDWACLLWIALVGLWVFDLAWFDLSPARLRSWLTPQPVLSLAGLIVGIIVLRWQLERQHKNSLEANRRQSQDRLKLDLYNKIAERIEATTTPLVEVGGLPQAFVGELIVRRPFDQKQVPPSKYFPQLRTKQGEAFSSVMSLVAILETHTIVMPEFAVFRKNLTTAIQALNVAVNDFAQAAFPFAGSDSLTPLRWPPNEEASRILSALADSAMSASISLTGVVWDLRVEAQNYLLGNLFPGRRVPPRTPGDTSVRVTTLPLTSGAE